MAVKMLTEKAGPLQGMGPSTIARQVYGQGAQYREGDEWGVAYSGAIVRHAAGRGEDEFDVLDYVVEVHEI